MAAPLTTSRLRWSGYFIPRGLDDGLHNFFGFLPCIGSESDLYVNLPACEFDVTGTVTAKLLDTYRASVSEANRTRLGLEYF